MEKKKKSIEDITISLKPSSINDIINAMDKIDEEETKEVESSNIDEKIDENIDKPVIKEEKEKEKKENTENKKDNESKENKENKENKNAKEKRKKDDVTKKNSNNEKKDDELVSDDENSKEASKEAKIKKNPKKKTKKKEEKEPKTFKELIFSQFTFKLVSILFWIGCLAFYGSRMIHYYKIFNPKTANGDTLTSLGSTIRQNTPVVSEKDGLYNISGSFFFKGKNVDNYVMYSNRLWRVVRINSDNSVQLVTDDSVNNLAWDSKETSFKDSNIYAWLNEKDEKNTGIFAKTLNNPDKYLVKGMVCDDKIGDLNKITCEKQVNIDYISLLGINDYANTITDDTFINNGTNLWLNNQADENKAWYIASGAIKNDDLTKGYGIKPVITVKNTVAVISGDGKKESPYIIEEEEKNSPAVGDIVEIDNNQYTIYEIEKDSYRIVANKLYNNGDTTYKFSSSSNKYNPEEKFTLANHVVNDLFTESTKKYLVDCSWYIGDYTKETNYDYKNVYAESVSAKIGLYNVADIKFDIKSDDYFYLTAADDNTVYGYSKYQNLYSMRPTYMKSIRPAMCLDKKTKMTGKGTIEKPYKVGEANEEKEEN